MIRRHEAPLEVKAFIEGMKRSFGGILAPRRDVYIVRAPARLELMGGLAARLGAVVLQTTLSDATVVGVQRRTDRRVLVRSLGLEKDGFCSTVEFDLDRALQAPEKSGPASRLFAKEPQAGWAASVAAVFQELVAYRKGPDLDTGVNIGIQSSIPMRTGLGASTALVCATAIGLIRLFGIEMPASEIPVLCHRAETRLWGTRASIADTLTVCLCGAHEVLAIRCQPGEIIKRVQLPQNVRFVGLNTLVQGPPDQHYLQAQIAASMGAKIMLRHARKSSRGRDDYEGYLCNIPISEFGAYRRLLPARLTGREFKALHGSLRDYGVSVDPATAYRVRSCTEHLLMEHRRTEQVLTLLADAEGELEEAMAHVGRLMYDSHESTRRDCALVNREADTIVNLVKEHGVDHGLYGARASGRQQGGVVAVAANTHTDDVLRNILAQYQDSTGREGRLHAGSVPGALLSNVTVAQFS
ncbi:MAG: hypothetical protein ONB30_06015 [candidate division KSB1 bacterium]|nr:hypothetical protein [candidate division KSB1 bacterium]